jgi:flagellar basal-body rod protein FlgB
LDGHSGADPFEHKDGSGGGKFRGETEEILMATDALFGIHGAALQIRSQRLSMLASNIANAATPGFKARDIDFTKALDTATGSRSNGSISDATNGAMGYRVPVQTSIDGNTVELPTEQTKFAENAVAYKTTLTFLQGRVDTVMQALKGDNS